MPCFAPRCLPEAYLYYNTSTEAVPSFQVASKRRKNTTAAHFLDVPHSLSQSGCAVMLAGAEPWPTVPSWRTTELLVASALVRDAALSLFYATAHTEQKSRHTASGWLSQHDHTPFRVAGSLAFLADLGFLPLQIGTYATQVLWARSVLLTSPVIATCGLSLTIPVAMATDSVSDRTLCLCAALSSQVRAKSAEQTRRCQ